MANEVKVTVHTDCVGTNREGKPIMVSLDSKYTALDAFLTKEEALELIKELQDAIVYSDEKK
jgi:uncharacterized protein related to proFAR isomerase